MCIRDRSGISVSTAGDVNGDGYADILIGARLAAPGGDSSAGETYVVFGKSESFGSSVDLGTLDGSDGFVLEGIDEDDYSGISVSEAGDVNGDGLRDISFEELICDQMGCTRLRYVLSKTGEGFLRVFGE